MTSRPLSFFLLYVKKATQMFCSSQDSSRLDSGSAGGVAVRSMFVSEHTELMVVVRCCFRETVAQMIQGGHRVIDNPVYLSDLGIVWLCLSVRSFVWH